MISIQIVDDDVENPPIPDLKTEFSNHRPK